MALIGVASRRPTGRTMARLVEEAVSNALRHGHASRVLVVLRLDEHEWLTIRVDDDGAGLPVDATPSGLAKLGDRIDDGGGTLELGSAELGGARVVMRLPVGGP